VAGLEDFEPGPRKGGSPLSCSGDVAVAVLRLRRDYPNYGPKKLWAVLERDLAIEDVPSARTISRILERYGLTRPRKVRRKKTGPTNAPVLQIERPNDVWSVDFKGWWRTGNGKKVEPLTVQDRFSRFVLTSELVDAPSFENVKGAFEELFTARGLPRAIQSDGGPPFAATSGVVGLSRLSAWWVALGIQCHRSRPACPQDNGGHERMHRDMADDQRVSTERAERCTPAPPLSLSTPRDWSPVAFQRAERAGIWATSGT
jgi:transposase InsO family protein